MSDLAVVYNPETFAADLVIAGGDLAVDRTLASAVVASLFTDLRALATDALPEAGADRRGFWADGKLGSKLWLLWREKQTEETRARAEDYCRQALAWMVAEGVAKSVSVAASWVRMGLLGFDIVIVRPDNVPERYRNLWRLAA